MTNHTVTEADRTMIKALAAQVCVDRLARLHEAGTTSKGRIIGVLVGEPTAAEVMWDQIQAPPARWSTS